MAEPLFLIRFIPYQHPTMTDAVYRSKERARAQFDALSTQTGRVTIEDDFGMVFCFDPELGILLLTDTTASAALAKEMTASNAMAAKGPLPVGPQLQ